MALGFRRPLTVLVAGVSTRAAAESAARAGFDVVAVDAYGDLDQHPSVRSLSLPRDFGSSFTPRAAACAAREIPSDAAVYLSSFENHPAAVRILATGRALWGNTPDVLRRVRNPREVANTLDRCRLPTPIVLPGGGDLPTQLDLRARRWLVKPRASGGGSAVRYWRPGSPVRPHEYVQELIEGTPASIAFVAAGGRAVVLGVTSQLVGERAFGASGFRYCGSILDVAPSDRPPRDDRLLSAIANVVAQAFDLVGVGSIDFIDAGGVAYPIEVNPRWSASMELVERACGVSVFGMHADACARGVLPPFDLTTSPANALAYGKAILFATRDVVVGDTRIWLEDPRLRDLPHPGERIREGAPICTILEEGRDELSCREALLETARRVYGELQ